MQQGHFRRQSFTRYHASYGSTPSSRYSRSVALYRARPQRERVVTSFRGSTDSQAIGYSLRDVLLKRRIALRSVSWRLLP